VPLAFTAIVPVRSFRTGKGRLSDDPAVRARFARAFALDTVGTVLATPSVERLLVVTDDDEVADLVRSAGATVVADPPAPDGGLNRALAAGAAEAARERPDGAVVALVADLVALTPAALDDVLQRAAAVPRAFVPDHAGTGTTMLTSVDPSALAPAFGPGSAAAHEASGAVRLGEVAPVARLDCDTPDDLAAAMALGLAPHTRALAATLRPRWQ
jgi:2-phospho-L-lactate guanylyltransferase